MIAKSSVPLLCRFCGEPIPKRTEQVFFGHGDGERSRTQMPGWSYRAEKPTSRDQAQRLINQQIVAVRWWVRDVWDGEKEKYTRTREYIDQVSTWDGESYEDPFFCNGKHAQRFGYAMARMKDHVFGMPAYWDALRAQQAPKAVAA